VFDYSGGPLGNCEAFVPILPEDSRDQRAMASDVERVIAAARP
jgi:hypothetical protein